MQIQNTILQTRNLVKQWRLEGLTIGFVPTMGFLHEGHISLITRAKEVCDKIVVSIFVNPTQFAPSEDLSTYPRDLENDLKMLQDADVDLVFVPNDLEMYPTNFTYVNINSLSESLCGKSRPNHFKGVCTIVTKLFNIVTPTHAFFGQKDAQQGAIITQMVKDLNMDIVIELCPTIRDSNGLAKSSRNSYLNSEELKAALVLSRSISLAKTAIAQGDKNTAAIRNMLISEIKKEPLAQVDYVEIVHSKTLQHIEEIQDEYLIALAVFIGKTRLIDNYIGGLTN